MNPVELSREDIEGIRALAEIVPQRGPWFVCERPNDDGTSNIETGRIGDWNPAQNCENPCANYLANMDPDTIAALCTVAMRYLKLRDGNVVACYTVPPDDTQPGVRISGPALDAEVDK